jgi:hypothetical protein
MGTRGYPIFLQKDNYQFVNNPTQTIQFAINKIRACNRSTTLSLDYQHRTAWFTSSRKLILAYESKNTNKNKKDTQ